MRFLNAGICGCMKPAVLNKTCDRAILLSEAGLNYSSLEELARLSKPEELARLKAWLEAHPQAGIALHELALLPAIAEPQQEILIQENNFAKSEKELRVFRENHEALPTYYYKKATFATSSGGVIPAYPGYVTELDYQAELCAVVAGDVYQISRQEAAGRIFGYTLINNVIARDLTRRHRRPYLSTSLDGFLPMGQFLVTPDEITGDIVIRSYVNGQLRQSASASLAKFGFDYAIWDLSRVSVLRGGSIITLGTPFGTGQDQTPPCYLKAGDVVTCQAEGIGQITNIVA